MSTMADIYMRCLLSERLYVSVCSAEFYSLIISFTRENLYAWEHRNRPHMICGFL